MRVFLFLILIAAAMTANAETTFIFLRHAEKLTDIKDPPLSQQGHQRAICLAGWIKAQPFANNIQRVYSSDYRRTLETAAPLAAAMAVNIRLYDPRKLPELAAELEQLHSSVIIVGHSNTTPLLAGLLAKQEIPQMAESDYDSFWQLVKTQTGYQASKLNQESISCD